MTENIKILHVPILHEPTDVEPFVVVDKPSGLASAPLREGDDCVLTRLLSLYPEIAAVRGRKEVEGGLLHRLDTATSGLLLVATSQEFYDRVIAVQEAGGFVKTYSAECHDMRRLSSGRSAVMPGFPAMPGFPDQPLADIPTSLFCVQSRFRPWGAKGREVRPVLEGSGRAALKKASPCAYRTEFKLEMRAEESVRMACRITKGYRHQVRCHLAWIGFPVKGDSLYNPYAAPGDKFCFRAIGLDFLGLSFRAN